MVAASQKLVNHLIDTLFQSDTTLKEINWYRIPGQLEDLMDPPWGHVFASSKSHAQHGYEDLYEFVQTVNVIIGYPQQEPDSQDRQIHTIEEAIEDLIILNRQPTITGLTVFDTRSMRSDYLSPAESGVAVDTLLMQIDFHYTRVVT